MALTETTHTGEGIRSEAPGFLSRDNITLNSGQDLGAMTVLGQIMAGVAAADGGNTGDGTASAVTIGKNAEAGVYTITCEEVVEGTPTGVIAADGGNTGDGVLGTMTLGSEVEVGIYSIEATSTGPAVASTGTGAADANANSGAGNVGNGTITGSPATGANAVPGVYRVICSEEHANLGHFFVEDPSGVIFGTATVGTEFSVGAQITFTLADGSTDFEGGDAFNVTVLAADSGTFVVNTPSGYQLADTAEVASAYTSDHVNFTIADGATDFVVGDKFTITVSANGARFAVRTPQGVTLEDLLVGSAYSAGDHFGVTISDGATDFVVGDKFTITNTAGDWEQLDLSGTDGTQRARGILVGAIDASSADTTAANFARDGEVIEGTLTWPSGITAGQKTAAIAELALEGIVVRL